MAHSLQCTNYSRLPMTLSLFAFVIAQIPGMYHRKQWSLPSCVAQAQNPLPQIPSLSLRPRNWTSSSTDMLCPALSHRIRVHEYLEDLVSQVGAPLLQNLHIEFFHVPQLYRLINHAEKKGSRLSIEQRCSSSDSPSILNFPEHGNLISPNGDSRWESGAGATAPGARCPLSFHL